MVEKPNSPQQSPTHVIQRFLGGLDLEGTMLAIMPVEAEEEIAIIQVANEGWQDRGGYPGEKTG